MLNSLRCGLGGNPVNMGQDFVSRLSLMLNTSQKQLRKEMFIWACGAESTVYDS